MMSSQRDEEIRRFNEELEQRVIERIGQLMAENARLFAKERQACERISSMQRQLFQAQKMEAVGQLAGGVAHELNNQLTIIYACVDLYLSRLPEDDPLRHALLKIRKSAQVSANLTRQLLVFGGKKPHLKTPTDLNHNVEELQEMMQRLLGEKIAIRLAVCPDLWPVNADPSNIDQVIVNLVLNARDAMPEGGVITIETRNLCLDRAGQHVQGPGRYVCLSVSDTGAGIDEIDAPHIFEPFFTTKEPGKGTGLGLSVVYGIIQAHDGWIEVDSVPGRGSTFRIYLPALPPGTRVIKDAPCLSPDEFRGRGENVLLVEDDPDVMSLTGSILTEYGYRVRSCSSAAEAEALLASGRHTFDLVLSDAVLPDCRGADLILRLRGLQPSLPGLLISGYAGERVIPEGLQQEQIPRLPKPYTAADLLKQIRDIIGTS